MQPLAPQASVALREIPAPPVACVVPAYPKAALKHSLVGFGSLIPRSQGIGTLRTIWSSSLFSGRAPEEWQMLTNLIGSATDRAIRDLESEQSELMK